MLHEFLNANREELISRCRDGGSKRHPQATEKQLEYGIPVFFSQIADILKVESLRSEPEDPSVAWDTTEDANGIGMTADRHGRELFQSGFTAEQVVREYGDICQAVTGLAIERSTEIPTIEFRTLNRCLDIAIAAAITAFARVRDQDLAIVRAAQTARISPKKSA